MTFGEKIRYLREEKDLSQKQLGETLHMTQRKVSYIENDRFEPSLQDLFALCRFFQISADALLGLNPFPIPSQRKNKKRTD